MKAVVDADVWLAAYEPDEPSHAEASAFIREAIAHKVSFHLPALAMTEVAASSARRTQDTMEGSDAMERLKRTPGALFFELSLERAMRAGELASRRFLRGADATYAALASEQGADLVSLDQELRRRAGTEIAVLSPAEWLGKYAPAQP